MTTEAKPRASKRAPREQLTEEVGTVIWRARRHIFARASRSLEAAGFSVLTWRILASLEALGPSTQRAIADYLAQDGAGVSRQLDALEEQALVRRTRDRTDRRKVLVALTAAGLRLHRRMRPIVHEAVEGAMTPLTVTELRSLKRLLLKIGEGAA